ncbi:MAG: citrate synthase [Myxococcaceae bacterium]|nr:citrate synthase [Myxococcaceae bacterium]
MGPAGLDGVVAAETRLSDVNGEAGTLIIAGAAVEALAGQVSFEQVCALVLGGTEAGHRRDLAQGRVWAAARVPGQLLDDPMDALRAATAQLPGDATPAQVIAAVGVFAAAWARKAAGLEPGVPDPSLGHAADLLRLMRGNAQPPEVVRAFEAYLVTVCDHGMNASTFAARVVASTRSDLVSSVVAAIGALKGPLHGGAPGPVLDMLDAIGDAAGADAWLRRALDAGDRVMGMGHRIYRVRDPRALVLERALAELERARSGGLGRLALARAVERRAEALLAERHPDRPLKANVEFYTAVLLEAVGVPRALFTAVFASARVAGWCAHVAEQRESGRLIRPQSRYVGPRPA